MRNFKKIVLMFVVLICMEGLAGFLLEPVTYQHSLDRELEYMEKQGWFPDMVLLGDSMVLCGLVPEAMEETMEGELCVLNAATGSQQVWGSYYYLEDLAEQYELKYVILGVDQWAFTQQEQSIKRDLIVLDRIKSFPVKIRYVSSIFEPAEYPYLLKSYANREEFENIPLHVKEKLTSEYLFGKVQCETKAELSRGHVSNGPGMGEEMVGIQELDPFTEQTVDQRAVKYLDKIVELCKSKGVKLYLVSMPVTSPAVYATETYGEFWSFFTKYAEENDVSFWDMNMLKDRKEVIPDGMMYDNVHIGEPGDWAVSRKMGELLSMDMSGENVQAEFWTFPEWKKSLTGIIGCDFSTEEIPQKKDRRMKAFSIQADGVIPEYEFWVSTDGKDGEWIKLQEYGTEDSCVVPGQYFEQDVWMKVCCREKGGDVSAQKSCVRMRSPEMGE